MKKPDFDSIKTYDEFKKYQWNRIELIDICKKHGLLFVGSEKKLNKVIEAYYNGVKIPPRRNWYSNIVLNSYVNENGLLTTFDFCLFAVNLILVAIGLYNYARGTDEISYVFHIVFGLTGLFVAILFIYWGQDLTVLRSYVPRCGDKRFTRAQVDEQANSPQTERLRYEDILLAPDMVIGVTAGIAAIAYEDIASLQVKQRWHTRRIGPRGSHHYEQYYTYKIVVRTNKGKKVAISNSKNDPGSAAKRIHEHCLQHNPEVKLLDMKKSSMAPDESSIQITEGSDVKKYVEQAIQEQYISRISADEDLKKQFVSFHLRAALLLIPESLLVAAISIVILSVSIRLAYTMRGTTFFLAGLIFPFYAVFNLFSTLRTIRKDDIEFYSVEIVNKSEKGYSINGVNYYKFGYLLKMMPAVEPNPGDRVILARFKNDFSLISDNRG